jgi:hypothetical protein
MTPEEAYWHACTGTPIDAPTLRIPRVVSSHYDGAIDAFVYDFEDGTIIKLYRDDVMAARQDRRYVGQLIEERYLEARGSKP